MVKGGEKIGAILFMFAIVIVKAQTYYVSANGATDYNSLKEVYDVIPQPLTQNVEIRLKNDGNPIPLISGETSFEWTKTGTDEFYIKLISDDFNHPASITRESSTIYMIVLKNIKNIQFYNIIFENSSLALKLDNVDHSHIEYCKFLGEPILDDSVYQIQGGCGGSTIWVGSEIEQENSTYNTIAYNFFDSPKINTYIRKHLYHSIYISYHSNYNSIIGNTIENPSGTGIGFNHSFQLNNTVRNNCINKIYEQTPEVEYSDGDVINDCYGNSNTYTIQGNGRDQFINSMQGIKINAGNGVPPHDNQISNNYMFSDINNDGRYHIYNMNSNLIIDAELAAINIIENNHFDTQKKVYDSYWMDYQADKINDRMVSGDFDNDGTIDDVVTFKNTDHSETTINVFLGRNNDNSFEFLSQVINGYLADKITGRTVSGDFDNDGFHDDIAVFYKYGNSETRIHTFCSDGGSFLYSGSSGWWNSSGYIADKITGRIVSGDFDNDGFHDDIAAFHKYGNSETRIHTFRSDGGSFLYSGSSGWWNSSEYIADKITGRIVSGDFNENGMADCFVGLYSYGDQKSRTHGWYKTNGENSFNQVNTSMGIPWVITQNSTIALNTFEPSFLKKDEVNDQENELQLKIYPNPVQYVLTIKYDKQPEEIMLFDINGELVKMLSLKDTNHTQHTFEIDLTGSSLKKGWYVLKLKTAKKTVIRKVIIK